jgi:hypothetical protein
VRLVWGETDKESRLQRSQWFLADEPGPLARAGMTDAFGVTSTPLMVGMPDAFKVNDKKDLGVQTIDTWRRCFTSSRACRAGFAFSSPTGQAAEARAIRAWCRLPGSCAVRRRCR